MRRTCPILVAALLCLALLSGCMPKGKQWAHPRIADPRKEDLQFQEDTRFCQAKLGAQAEDSPALADCYRRLGWQPREKD